MGKGGVCICACVCPRILLARHSQACLTSFLSSCDSSSLAIFYFRYFSLFLLIWLLCGSRAFYFPSCSFRLGRLSFSTSIACYSSLAICSLGTFGYLSYLRLSYLASRMTPTRAPSLFHFLTHMPLTLSLSPVFSRFKSVLERIAPTATISIIRSNDTVRTKQFIPLIHSSTLSGILVLFQYTYLTIFLAPYLKYGCGRQRPRC